ncbi:MAG: TonB-dependent receptor [Acidobacteriota bacterium]|nr:TonB-dependent receptor [Acidobacteriota bacterium]
MKTQQIHTLFLIVICNLGLTIAVPVQAQESEEEEKPVILEEIVVTAEKRISTVRATPQAVSAFDQIALDRHGVARTEDLAMLVPNFKFGDIDVGYGGAQLTIRGISNDNITNDGDPSIAVHLDGIYLPRISSSNSLFYDMERVEVLRGPQGTLYGRNTTSGTVNVIPNRPILGSERSASLSSGSESLLSGEGMINASLIDSTLATRVALSYRKHDGTVDNGPAPDGNDADQWGARASLLYTPTDSTSLLMTVDYFEEGGNGSVMAAAPYDRSSDPTGFAYPFATDPQNFGLNTDPFVDNNDWGIKAELNHSFIGAELTWLTAFRGHQRNNRVDRDGTDLVPTVEELMRFSGPFADTPPVVGPTTGNYAVLDQTSDSISSELRLSGSTEKMDWLIGLYAFKESQDAAFDAFVEGLKGAGFIAPVLGLIPPQAAADPAVRVKRFTDQTAESNAAFGEVSYRFGANDRFRLTGGLRWTEDKKDDGDGSYAGFTLEPLTAPQSVDPSEVLDHAAAPYCEVGGVTIFRCVPRIQNDSWSELTWKAGFNWDVNDDWMVYANASRGYRSGGFNDTAVYAPEFLDALEGGAKGRFWNGRGQMDLAFFHYDFKDQQVSQVVEATTVTVNAGASTLYGMEATANLLPTTRSRLAMTLGLLHAEYDVFDNVDDPQTPGVILEDLSGNSLIKAPDVSLNINWEPYVFDIGEDGTLTPKIQFHYESEFYLLAFNNPQNLQDDYTRTDLRLVYEFGRGRFAIEFWVRNLEDDDVLAAQITTPNRLLTPPNAVGFPPGAGREELLLSSYAPPRTFGLTFRVR